MTDSFGIIYGAALICGGLLGYFRTGSVISLIATVLGAIMLYRFYVSGKVFPALIVVGLSVAQAYRNYSMMK
ncbi:unnamed protein product [Rotaria magnacalcarata]|uniref:Transmembrane protein 14C n=1 Tax=Rotaria magnacalcarata TaxID=392030 RepID=A0A8S2NGV9_9BILA|nr:unnamed protein product [Rotaria magnacalcarata]